MRLGVITVCLTLALVWVAMGRMHSNIDADSTPECIPEGGLTCAENTLQICKNKQMVSVGPCVGGCVENDGIARCLNERNQLIAPLGTACSKGMAVCGMQTESLLVCRQDKLAFGAKCPGGCYDLGETRGLYCMSDNSNIRFAPDFPCPKFSSDVPFVCGPDSKTLLTCQNGTLAPHTVTCARCEQLRTGHLTCFNAENKPVDPKTGSPRP